MDAPSCAGESWLFDSTDPFDHREARSLCTTCPIWGQCLDLALTIARTNAHRSSAYRGPDGTWAGLLWRNGGVVTPARHITHTTEEAA